jgi:predicted DNA-binding transcriptional regulator AlpA
MNDPIYNEDEAARHVHVSPRSLQRWRAKGGGPRFIRLGEKKVGYRESALTIWTESRSASSRAEELARDKLMVTSVSRSDAGPGKCLACGKQPTTAGAQYKCC